MEELYQTTSNFLHLLFPLLSVVQSSQKLHRFTLWVIFRSDVVMDRFSCIALCHSSPVGCSFPKLSTKKKQLIDGDASVRACKVYLRDYLYKSTLNIYLINQRVLLTKVRMQLSLIFYKAFLPQTKRRRPCRPRLLIHSSLSDFVGQQQLPRKQSYF